MKTICKHGVNLSITACGQCIIEDCQKTIAMIEADHAENDRKRAAVTVDIKEYDRVSVTIDMPAIPLLGINSVRDHK